MYLKRFRRDLKISHSFYKIYDSLARVPSKWTDRQLITFSVHVVNVSIFLFTTFKPCSFNFSSSHTEQLQCVVTPTYLII